MSLRRPLHSTLTLSVLESSSNIPDLGRYLLSRHNIITYSAFTNFRTAVSCCFDGGGNEAKIFSPARDEPLSLTSGQRCVVAETDSVRQHVNCIVNFIVHFQILKFTSKHSSSQYDKTTITIISLFHYLHYFKYGRYSTLWIKKIYI